MALPVAPDCTDHSAVRQIVNGCSLASETFDCVVPLEIAHRVACALRFSVQPPRFEMELTE
jgi:hypothetical protein